MTEKNKRRIGLKQVLLTVVVLAVVGSLIQVALRAGFGGALNTTGGTGKGQTQDIKPTQAPKTVKLNGKSIPGSAGPVIVANPGLVVPGGKANIEGGGFDPKSTVDILLVTQKSDKKGQVVAKATTDKWGTLIAQFTVPDNMPGSSVTAVAQQRNSANTAETQISSGGGIGYVTLNKVAGKPGDSVSVSARGFSPGESIEVHWGRISGTPVTTLTADGAGGVGRADFKVGVAPTGPSTLVLIGKKSQTAATASFLMLGLYPSVKPSPYALKAGQRLALTAKGFAPNERVLIYVNAAGGVPAFTAQADGQGQVGNVGFVVPFGPKGSQSLTLIGDRTRTAVRAGFQVLPYTPTAEASTFGGKAGTTLSFYATGFAPNEQVTVYAGGNKSGGGKKIATFSVDGKGKAEAAGSYMITKADEGGVSFRLVGQKSGSTANASVNAAQKQG
jgi:hypothetical protein